MRITVGAEGEVDLRAEIRNMTEDERDELRLLLEMDEIDRSTVRQWIDRIKYKGLDTDLTALEVLEKIDTELGY